MAPVRALLSLAAFLFASLPMAPSAAQGEIRSPEAFFGFRPGSDRELIDYEQLIAYLEELDAASARIEMRRCGTTPMGKPMCVAFLSSVENIAALDELRAINERLALDAAIPAHEREALVRRGKVFVMETLSMHSTEVGPSQALPLFAYEMATTQDAAALEQLGAVVLMIVPCHNPDGMDLVVQHYRKYKGTRLEGCSLPGVYHRYVGHDNNRDFVALTQSDTRAISALYSTSWYPQVLCEKHQMGSTGPRYFVPPNHDPIAENIPAGLWHWLSVFGANLGRDMGGDGLQGVASHWTFDNYWPGSTETSLWKNVISFLTECASCRVATPVFVEPTELSVRGKGLAEYEKSVNMPAPWPGGWWRLGDIVSYELSSLHSILGTATRHRAEILRFRNELCRAEVERGRSEAPAYYVFATDQHDRGELVELVRLLRRHGVVVRKLSAQTVLGGRVIAAGSLVVPLAQPYRAFVKEVLEKQRYPARHYTPGGEIIRPYDITSWSLPLHKGVAALEIEKRSPQFESRLSDLTDGWRYPAAPAALPAELYALAFSANDNAAYAAAFRGWERGIEVSRLEEDAVVAGQALPRGSFLLRCDAEHRAALGEILAALPAPAVVIPQPLAARSRRIERPRIALVETWFSDMDAGWTRFLFDSYHIPYAVVHPGDFAKTEFRKDFDVVVFPDASKDVLVKGRRKRGERYRPNDYPPEFQKGIGDEGMKRLMSFVDGGGIIVSWRRSTALFLDVLAIQRGEKKEDKEEFQLPARDISEQLDKEGLYVPGSFLRIALLPGHPLTLGMPAFSGIFSRGAPLFATSIPRLDMDRRVIAWHPKGEVLLSGYIDKGEKLARRAVMVWLRKGRGQFVLMGFNPQFRASTPASYKLLFNALLLARRN